MSRCSPNKVCYCLSHDVLSDGNCPSDFFLCPHLSFVAVFFSSHFSSGILVLAAVAVRKPQSSQLFYFLGKIKYCTQLDVGLLVYYV